MQTVTPKNDVAWTIQAITALSIPIQTDHTQWVLNLNPRSTQSSPFLMMSVILRAMILKQAMLQ